MIMEDRRKLKRSKKNLHMVTGIDPATGHLVTEARRNADESNPARSATVVPPSFFPEHALSLNHWALPTDLRLSRREANVAGLRFYLTNASLTDCCKSDRIVPLVDLICAAADACSAASAQWDVEQQDLVDLMTGGPDHVTHRSGLAEYAARKSERDMWRQKLRDMTGPLEADRQRSVDAMDDSDLWQLLAQVDYAIDCYRDAGGK